MLSPNSWLAIARAPPLQPTAPAGILCRPPPLPDPPDPTQFPPLPAPRSPSNLSKPSSLPPSQPLRPVHPTPTTTLLSAGVLPPSSASLLLASFLHSPFPNCSPNPIPISSTTMNPPLNPQSLPPISPPQPSSLLGAGPSLSQSPLPHPFPFTDPSPPSAPPTWASKVRSNTDRTLCRLSPQTFSPSGVPRVIIPDEVYQKGAELHKDFLICRFFGRIPAYKLIQNVLNYLWGKGKHLEIHMLPTTNSALVRLSNDFIREKVLLKRFWYVETSMFHVSQWSESATTTTPSLQRIQLWAHLKGVPFDLIYNLGSVILLGR
ncbi:unnamed protein product [Brassica rapa]|uniref:DUF4283 domain-containing protein n=1 Tax=Brassica campestris TaxID=3711 RepID=A0A8D9MAT9_BRACM|nr:unnamed protein product [Brassica rapa]